MRRAQQLGRYHLLDRIAFGGMAEIYRAKTFDATGHAHLVAVKRVLAHLAEDDDFIQMLVDEAKIAGLLRHANIARVYEFARAHGEYFIAMEYVDGKDLRTILERCRQRRKAIPPQHAAYIASEIATGLHSAHVAVDPRGRPLRIVHRDVSPSNVICAYAGEVKLCDFGIAKATLSKVNTKTGVIKGKVKYMSPEQALGRKLDHRSDIFSLGACLYEMLTRVPPFTATNEMDLLIKVRDAKYRPVSEIVPGVPRELETICDRCLARSRAHRFQTGLEAAHALRGFLRAFMPEYTRSHLGRYVRKQFAQEIERELRMLEEYVLSDQVDDDVGENLIAGVLGPQADFSRFSPRPPGETGSRSGGTPPLDLAELGELAMLPPQAGTGVESAVGGSTGGGSEVGTGVDTGVDTGVETGVKSPMSEEFEKLDPPRPMVMAPLPPPPRPPTVLPEPEPPADDQAGLDVHDASTLILDEDRAARRILDPIAGHAAAMSQADADDGLHSAPTLILDHRRDRRRRPSGG
ncbi:MAG TPA: serine/threonine-protein kinase [Kofleriaceae bacterium]|nr:serine/threonine-protein kinase [Kofleriaceae bacterium]